MRKLYAGLDVSKRTTAICIVDAEGEVVHEASTETAPESIASILHRRALQSVGQESGSDAAWLHKALVKHRYPMRCLDAYHAHSALRTKLNKNDANDAQGIAILLARNIYTTSYIKSDEAIRIRAVLTLRDAVTKAVVSLNRSAEAVKKQCRAEPKTPSRRRKLTPSDEERAAQAAMRCTREALDALKFRRKELDLLVKCMARENDLCQRFKKIPGVGPITALTFVGAVDDPFRFASSRDVAAYFGLTPRVYQSGASTRTGHISRRGDSSARSALYAAGKTLLIRSQTRWRLRAWGLRIAKAKGYRRAAVAVARKLAVLMHHLWITGQEFDPKR